MESLEKDKNKASTIEYWPLLNVSRMHILIL